MNHNLGWGGIRIGLEQLIRDGNSPQIDLQIKCNPYQDSYCLFSINGQDTPKIHIELQETQHSQRIFLKE